jgi:hypothetical protein
VAASVRIDWGALASESKEVADKKYGVALEKSRVERDENGNPISRVLASIELDPKELKALLPETESGTTAPFKMAKTGKMVGPTVRDLPPDPYDHDFKPGVKGDDGTEVQPELVLRHITISPTTDIQYIPVKYPVTLVGVGCGDEFTAEGKMRLFKISVLEPPAGEPRYLALSFAKEGWPLKKSLSSPAWKYVGRVDGGYWSSVFLVFAYNNVFTEADLAAAAKPLKVAK